MVFMMISKAGKTSTFLIEYKGNAKCYCNALLKNMISEMNSLAKHNLFMQDWARAHTAKLEMLKDKKKEPQITKAPSLATK